MLNLIRRLLVHLGWWPKGIDQRQYFRKRVPDEVIVELVYEDEKGMHSYTARLVDVSEAGAQMITNHGRVAKGMIMVIKTSDKNIISTMSQEAEVMWVLKEGAAMRFGVKYTQLIDTPHF